LLQETLAPIVVFLLLRSHSPAGTGGRLPGVPELVARWSGDPIGPELYGIFVGGFGFILIGERNFFRWGKRLPTRGQHPWTKRFWFFNPENPKM
jgi:hypothetical protein